VGRLLLILMVVVFGIVFEVVRRSTEGFPAFVKNLYYWEMTGEYAISTAADIAAGHNLVGKVALVTGANSGLGKETARVLSTIGCRVVLACRSKAKCDKAKAEIEASEPRGARTDLSLSTAVMDLNSLKSVGKFAEDFLSREKRLDLLINNAGIMDIPTFETTEDGIEKQFGVNHIGHFHLTDLLLGLLKATAKQHGSARIVSLSSQAHQFASGPLGTMDVDFSALPLKPDEYDGGLAYGVSKVSNILFSLELRKRLAGTGVLAVAGHPGIIKTGLAQYSQGSTDFYDKAIPFMESVMGKSIMKSIPQGTSTTMCMALHDLPQGPTTDRLFLTDCMDGGAFPLRMSTRVAFDKAKATQLWTRSEQLVQTALKKA